MKNLIKEYGEPQDTFQHKILIELKTKAIHCENCLAMLGLPEEGITPEIYTCPNCGAALDSDGFSWDRRQ
jgi:Zn finger protein HypA/HybF involved in hydrogenase expression